MIKALSGLLQMGALICCLAACTAPPGPGRSTQTPLYIPAAAAISPPADTSVSMNVKLDKSHMTVGRAAHTATSLPNGTVLLTGGFITGEQALDSAEIFDPQTRKFTPTGRMGEARKSHTATLLLDGTVLVTGGINTGYLASAEIYDPETGEFTLTGSMTTARGGHRAVLLQNGKVLLVGGTSDGWTFLASAEMYDPESGTFSPTGEMLAPRASHTATLLESGKVLVTGGHQGRRSEEIIYDSAEVYDPERGKFSAVGRMTERRHKHDATLLDDGRVLVTGGSDERDSQGAYRSTELYNPETGQFIPAGEMQAARYKHRETSMLLPDGRLLLIGGADTAEIYDPRRGTFTEVARGLGLGRLFATATLMANGDVLYAGGYGENVIIDDRAWVLEIYAG